MGNGASFFESNDMQCVDIIAMIMQFQYSSAVLGNVERAVNCTQDLGELPVAVRRKLLIAFAFRSPIISFGSVCWLENVRLAILTKH